MFPEDLGDFYMSLDFYDYRTATGDRKSEVSAGSTTDPLRRLFNADRSSVNNQIAKPSSFARIKLPIPTNLKDVFKVNYENTALGGSTGAMAAAWQAGGEGMQFVTNLLSGASNQEEAKAFSEFMDQAATASGKSIAAYLTEKNVLFGANLSGLWDLVSGTAVNPNLTVLFRGPTLKTHSFDWLLTPRTRKESENIRKMTAIIKRAMHPERLNSSTSAILRYPSECLIQFVGRKDNKQFLYPLRPTVVDTASFDYANNGVVSFFQDSDDTTSLHMSITFQETSYYTRDSFDSTSEYGSDGFNTSDLTNGGTNAFGEKS